MPKRLQDRLAPDSIREFRAAAHQRSLDATALAENDRRTAAIYLWGYASEMTLKSAYFRLIGFPESQPINRSDLRGAANEAVRLGVYWPNLGQYHNLKRWAQLLVAKRSSRTAWMYSPTSFGRQVVSTSSRLQELWVETLRYHKNTA